VFNATFAAPDLTEFCRLDELGLEAVGQFLEPDAVVLECGVVERDDWCRRYGAEGVPRDTVSRRLAHEPFGHRPTTLLVRVRRYRCSGCGRTWRQDSSNAAPPRAKISHGGLRWALSGIVIDHLTVIRVAAGLGVSWHTANAAIIAEGHRRLIDDPSRFDGVQRAADVLAFFDRPGTSNGPTEAINGRLEHLRGSALGFRNLTNYIARSILGSGGFRPHLHPG
jgi:transposase